MSDVDYGKQYFFFLVEKLLGLTQSDLVYKLKHIFAYLKIKPLKLPDSFVKHNTIFIANIFFTFINPFSILI